MHGWSSSLLAEDFVHSVINILLLPLSMRRRVRLLIYSLRFQGILTLIGVFVDHLHLWHGEILRAIWVIDVIWISTFVGKRTHMLMRLWKQGLKNFR